MENKEKVETLEKIVFDIVRKQNKSKKILEILDAYDEHFKPLSKDTFQRKRDIVIIEKKIKNF